jgi:hypothetical protein
VTGLAVGDPRIFYISSQETCKGRIEDSFPIQSILMTFHAIDIESANEDRAAVMIFSPIEKADKCPALASPNYDT